MAKKSSNHKADALAAEKPVPETTGEEPSAPPFEERDLPNDRAKTLYLKLDSDGNPAWSKMTPRTLETWKGVLAHPASRAAFSTEPLPPESKGASDKEAALLLGVFGSAQTIVLAKAYGLTLEESAELCQFSSEEIGEISPRLARVLNRRGGDWMAKYCDEIFLALSLAQAVSVRVQRAGRAVNDKRLSKAVEADREKRELVQ